MKTLVICVNRLPEYRVIRITNEEDIQKYYMHIQSESYEKPFIYIGEMTAHTAQSIQDIPYILTKKSINIFAFILLYDI